MNRSELLAEIAAAEFVARLCPGTEHYTDFGPFRALGFSSGEALVAGVVFWQMNGFDAVLSIASTTPRWATPSRIRQILRFGFEELGCVRLTAITARGNQRARKLLKGVGFAQEGMSRKGFDGKQDAIRYGLTRRDAARWVDKFQER